MRQVFEFFARLIGLQILKHSGILAGSMVAASYLGFSKFSLLLAFFWGEALLCFCAVANVLHSNMSWVFSLPLSKRQILQLNALLLLFAASLALCASATASAAYCMSEGVSITALISDLKVQSGLASASEKTRYLLATSIASTAMWALGLAASVPFWIRDHKAFLELQRNPAKMRRMQLKGAGFVFALVMVGYSAEYIGVFGSTLLILSMILLLSIKRASAYLALPRSFETRWLAAGLGFMALQGVVVYSVMQKQYSGSLTASLGQGRIFFGKLMTYAPKDQLRAALEGELDAGMVSTAGAVFKTDFNNKRSLVGAEGEPAFQATISTKTTAGALHMAINLYDAAIFSKSHLDLIFDRLETLDAQNTSNFSLYTLLPAKLSTEETLSYLTSTSMYRVNYALIRARFYRDSAFVPAIERKLSTLSFEQKRSAMKTLAILDGRELDYYEEYARITSGRSLASAPQMIDCGAFSKTLTDFKSLKPEMTQSLNACLRETGIGNRTSVHGLRDLDQIDRLKWPLVSRQKWEVCSAFKLKCGH